MNTFTLHIAHDILANASWTGKHISSINDKCVDSSISAKPADSSDYD